MFKKAIVKDINRLVNLRIAGFSLVSLSCLHDVGVHYTDLIYQFRKYNIKMENARNYKNREIYDIPRIINHLMPPSDDGLWAVIDGERINRGRSYSEYLALSHRNKAITR